MSTKIYDAYRIKKTDFDFAIFIKTIKNIENEIVKSLINKIIKMFIYSNELHYNSLIKDEELSFMNIIDLFLDEKNLKNDFSSKFSVVSFEDTGYFYFMFFTKNNYIKMFENDFPSLEDYHYQNQVDMPDDVSEEEWDKRSEKWDELMPSGIPAKDGIVTSIELIPYKIEFDIRENFKELIDNVIKDIDIKSRYKNLYQQYIKKHKTKTLQKHFDDGMYYSYDKEVNKSFEECFEKNECEKKFKLLNDINSYYQKILTNKNK